MAVTLQCFAAAPLIGRSIGILLCLLLFNSCVGLQGYDSIAELRDDAVAVFKQHNQTAGEVMLIIPELDPADPTTIALADADATMLAACEPLNELAIAQREGRKPTLRQRSRIPAAIDACREATDDTRSLLDSQR